MRWWAHAKRVPSGRPGLAVVLALVLFVASCGEDDPTSLGSDQRTHPDTLRVVELTEVVVDSVFQLPFDGSPVPVGKDSITGPWLGDSPTGQLGRQQLYTTHLLFAFQAPAFVVDDGDTLDLNDGRLEIGFVNAPSQTIEGTMQLSLFEVAPDNRMWTVDKAWADLPSLQPGGPVSMDTVPDFRFLEPEFEIELPLDPKGLVGFTDSLQTYGPVEINVALLFDGFVGPGKGFIEFPYSNNVRFVGNYRMPGGDTGIESSSTPVHRRAIVEFDPNYNPGTNLVTSDGHRFHTYLRFPNVNTVLPDSAFVHTADLILFQADRGDTIFGTGPNLGVVIPDTTRIYALRENERTLRFSTALVALPEAQVTINVTAYLFDQQEGDVVNQGILLRLSNEGTKARHFEFFGGSDPDPARRPRIRIVYGMPSDFGGGSP